MITEQYLNELIDKLDIQVSRKFRINDKSTEFKEKTLAFIISRDVNKIAEICRQNEKRIRVYLSQMIKCSLVNKYYKQAKMVRNNSPG